MIRRCKLKWIKGDENTKFFHRYLAERRRQLLISKICTSEGASLLSSTENENENPTLFSSL